MNGCVKSETGAARRDTFGRLSALHSGNRFQSLQQEIHILYCRWSQTLFGFLLASACFFSIRNLDPLAHLSESTRVVLGSPPPPVLTTIALSVYFFLAVVLIQSRTASHARPSLKWLQLVFRVSFFFFYAVANVSAQYFIAVFVTGLVIFGLELLNIRAYATKVVPQGGKIFGKS